MKIFVAFIFLVSSVFGVVKVTDSASVETEMQNDFITDLLMELGEDFTAITPDYNIENVSSAAGESIVKTGFAIKENGDKYKQQSKHFVCTSCHNVEKEDPDLTSFDPQARLDYTSKKGIPFLQGTTLYGAINRTSFYNGDYDKKYGDLVFEARDDIRKAIQLCATECAQGRPLKDWEMESIVAYLWDIGLKLDDLNLSNEEKENIKKVSTDVEKADAMEIIHSKYLEGSPATFIPPPADRNAGNGLVGNAENGQLIYESSCLHCHYQQKYSFLHLDKTNISINHLKREKGSYSSHSIYQVIRWGVPTYMGKRSYMPQYTEEKMSEQQLADLAAFLEVGYQ
jgi:mono/diheme cytochrome c family protein